jgi:hypothetical protein
MERFFKLTAIAFISPALFNITTSTSVKAGNPFDTCLSEIVNSGVTVEQANTACADALIPKELSYCVQKISNNTKVKAEDALKNCYQVRRPVDMANCVVDINNTILGGNSPQSNSQSETKAENATEENDAIEVTATTMDEAESPLMLALNTCRASLSPTRHSQCVIALSRTPDSKSPVKAMNTCISAEDFPRDLFPAY